MIICWTIYIRGWYQIAVGMVHGLSQVQLWTWAWSDVAKLESGLEDKIIAPNVRRRIIEALLRLNVTWCREIWSWYLTSHAQLERQLIDSARAHWSSYTNLIERCDVYTIELYTGSFWQYQIHWYGYTTVYRTYWYRAVVHNITVQIWNTSYEFRDEKRKNAEQTRNNSKACTKKKGRGLRSCCRNI